MKRKVFSIFLALALSVGFIDPPQEANAGVVATCLGSLDRPHHSHHFSKTVNAQARVKCNVNMAHITGSVTLIRDDGRVASSGIQQKWGSSKWKANAAMNCDGKFHRYTSTVSLTWRSPAGFRPVTGAQNFEKSHAFRC